MRRIMALLLVLIMVISFGVTAEDSDLSYVTSHKFTRAKVTSIPKDLKTVDLRGGTVIEFPDGFDFSKPNIPYGTNRNVAQLEYVDLGGGESCYKYVITQNNLASQSIYSKSFVPIKTNRNYLISLLVWLDYDRLNAQKGTCEVLSNLSAGDTENLGGVGFRKGLPDYTGGWQRFEYVASPGLMGNAVSGRYVLQTWQFTNGIPEGNVYLADLTIVELPEVSVTPYKEGEGVTFRGGAGSFNMKVESADETEENIIVNTVGARYTFNKKESTLLAEQKIGIKRRVSSWKSSVDFSDLSIKSTTEKECVITNKNVTFGVQLDGVLFLTPHENDITLTCTSEIAGMWNRLAYGFLISLDNYGGFTVTPDLPEGTGKLCNYKVLTENLDFANVPFTNAMMYDKDGTAIYYNEFISNAKSGWQIQWTMSPGERLAICTFPPREYDWKSSFESTYRNINNYLSTNLYPDDYQNYEVRAANLWDFSDVGYAMEWQGHYMQSVHKNQLIKHISAAKEVGMKAIMYAPAYFYYNKESADEYITEIKRLRDTYGIDGIYSDGIPSEHQWVTGYEESRMLRELFPDGFIVAHQTGNPQNGGGPLSAAALFLPFVDTYWNATLKGESVAADNFKAPIASMTWAQYNVANCVGIQKGDEWFYFNSEGKRTKIPQGAQDLLMLEFNGRPRITLHDDEWKTNFVTVLRKLKKVWEENGDKPNFYDKYYAPAAREYIRPYLQKYGDIQILSEKFDTDNILSQYGIYNTNAQIASDLEDKKLKITGLPSYEEGSVLKRMQKISGEMTIKYSFEVLERGNFEQRFSDNYDSPAIGIAFGEDGKIKIRNISGNFVNIGEYKRNTKYNIRFEIDTDKHKYDVYINDIKMVGGLKLDEKVFGISEMEFTDGGFGSVCLIDNIKVADKF